MSHSNRTMSNFRFDFAEILHSRSHRFGSTQFVRYTDLGSQVGTPMTPALSFEPIYGHEQNCILISKFQNKSTKNQQIFKVLGSVSVELAEPRSQKGQHLLETQKQRTQTSLALVSRRAINLGERLGTAFAHQRNLSYKN